MVTMENIFVEIFSYLHGPNSHKTMGFINGFTFYFSKLMIDKSLTGREEIIESPIWSVFISVVSGYTASYCSMFVEIYTPRQIKFFLPTVLGITSCIYMYEATRQFFYKNNKN